MWRAGKTFPEIGSVLSVAEATAEVYVIDEVAGGRATPTEIKKLISDLLVNANQFRAVVSEVHKDGVTLREIRDNTGLRYNQIRGVVAYMIHDL